jgi:predicted ribonuclease YlaK
MGQIIKEMEDRLNHWKKVDGALFIADTNIYLHQEVEFQELDWENITEAGGRGAHLVIPLLVLVELDRHKRINGKVVSKTNNMPVRTRARMTLRYVNELFKETSESQVLKLANPPFGPVTTSLLLDNPRHSPLPDPDSEFLDRTRALKDFIDRDVCVLTSDSSMAFRARAIGLKVKRLPDN